MAKPVVLVVDDEADSLRALTQELESRYGAHYRIVARASATDALATLAELRAEDAAVPLVLADQWMPETTGIELLARTRELHPTARRGLLISWGDRSATAPILAAAALGQIEFYLPKPSWSPDEEFHLALTASLGEWWREQGGRFEAVTVIGGEHHARSHEIRDVLTRNGVPFGFHRGDSAEGRAALRRLGLRSDQGPVVALYSGTVLVDPTNAEVGAALGVDVRPPEQSYDVLIVGAGPAGLAAAVYGASEGLRTAALEREAFGGQAGTSSLIRNYPGFPWGVSGVELAWRVYQQAWTFGTQFVYGNPATVLADSGGQYVLGLEDGSEVRGAPSSSPPAPRTGDWPYPGSRRWSEPACSTAPPPCRRRRWPAGTRSSSAVGTRPDRPRCTCPSTRARSRSWSARGRWRRACPTT